MRSSSPLRMKRPSHHQNGMSQCQKAPSFASRLCSDPSPHAAFWTFCSGAFACTCILTPLPSSAFAPTRVCVPAFSRNASQIGCARRLAGKKARFHYSADGRIGYITGGVTDILAPSYLDEIFFNWRTPSAIVRHIKQIESEFPTPGTGSTTEPPVTQFFSQNDLESA